MSYSTGTVYKIICKLDSDIVYIGSTFNSLRNRWQHHKGSYKEYLNGKYSCVSIYPFFQKYGIENFKIIRIKEYECYRATRVDYKHLHAYEQLWINKTKNCINKYSPFSIPIIYKERQRQIEKIRYENNKERIKERVKLYAKEHKVEIKERSKIYREKNQDVISEKKKQPIFCIICKSSITSSHFKRHTRTDKHIQNAKQVIYNFIISKF